MDSVLRPFTSVGDDVERPSREAARAAARTLIAYTGDDPDRHGLLDTPERVLDAFDEMFAGYSEDPVAALSRTFEETGGYDDMVLVRDIGFASHCQHHLMPFMGKAHVAYYPDSRVAGLSKLARVVDIFARRLQTQENLTAQVAATLAEVLKPHGAAVLVEAEHLCMSLRGVTKPGATTITTHFTGLFREDREERARFLRLVRGG